MNFFKRTITSIMLFSNVSWASPLSALEQVVDSGAPLLGERPTLYIQCQLTLAMNCEDLKRAYFDRLPVIDRLDSAEAKIKIKLTDEKTPEGILVHAKWSAGTIIEAPLPPLLLPNQFDLSKIQSELITLITRPVAVIVQIESGTGLEELVIKNIQGSDPIIANESERPFFLEIGLNGNASKSGIGAKNPDGSLGLSTSNMSGMGNISLNRTTKKTRYSASFNANFSKFSQPGTDGSSIKAQNLSRAITLLGVYSLNDDARWNVALILNQSSDPGANIKNTMGATAGVEYNLVPFRVDQPYEFRVRTGVSTNQSKLLMPNDRGNKDEQYYTLGAQLFAFWLILEDRMSLNATLGGSTILSYSGYSSAAAGVTLNYQISRSVSFSSNATYAYVKKNINFPATPDLSNPLQTQYLSGFAGGSYFTSIGLTIRIGQGGTLLSRDRRFQ